MIKVSTKLTNYEPSKIEFKLNVDITGRKNEVNCLVNGHRRDPRTIVPPKADPVPPEADPVPPEADPVPPEADPVPGK